MNNEKPEEKVSLSGKKMEVEKELSPQEIVEGFRKLRDEQQIIISKISELESDSYEHKLVADTLESIDSGTDRHCFRMIGGVLVERTVNETFPALKKNSEKIDALVASLKENLVKKGKEISEYRDKHNIRFMNEMEMPSQSEIGSEDDKNKCKFKDSKQTGGVLVS